ncbi:M1 family metallopeptidase [Winogradskyella aurantiaca]|uniref:M1 family metallopeptidase n=1 Tax=Winogradskyella aurantiaca TaxID=2219558 RepID=UPI000E1D75BE|nr:M1 family metallopeptidase [Winogradskyella aurantiaca]
MRILVVLFVFMSLLLEAQQTEYVDFKQISADLEFVPDSAKVKGQVAISFKILQTVDSVSIDAKNFEVCNGDATKWINYDLKHSYDGQKIWIKGKFVPGEMYTYNLHYETVPKKALYFLTKNGNYHIWTQGQGKYTSNWLPSFDDVNEKVVFDLQIQFDKDYKVLANGQLDKIDELEGLKAWHYSMKKPMSSYLVALVIGKYEVDLKKSDLGTLIELYYYPEKQEELETTYRYSKGIFDFMEQELEYEYPWLVYRQVPVHDFLYAGMENTSLTIFSDAFVVDSIGYNDANYINVNAHELAHQWFGDLVTAKSGEHHWLQEGFATYYALLAERELFGDDHYHFQLYQSAQELGRQDDAGNGTSLLNPKSSSLTFYQRGAWVLHALRTQIGNAAFRRAVNTYLKTYEFSSAETDDFLSIVEAQTEEDLSEFKEMWIVQRRFPFEAAIALLRKQSEYINEYIMIDCSANSSKCADYLKYGVSDEAKIKVISQQPGLVTKTTFKNGYKVRRAIAQYVTTIPKGLKSDYETLLKDPSYQTVESALYNLWVNFPADRSKYLSLTKSIEGNHKKNVRLLWLILNLNTPEYQSDQNQELYNELVSYTNPMYNADLRMDTFQYLELLKACNDACKINLEQAKSHHNWRLVKFAKETRME